MAPPGATNESPVAGWKRFGLGASIVALLYLAMTLASYFVPHVLLGMPIGGWLYATAGVVQAAAAIAGFYPARRFAGLPVEAGVFYGDRPARGVAFGLLVAAAFYALQFGLIIPSTGGRERSDVAVNMAQIDGQVANCVGIVVLAFTGVLAEELMFRGLLLSGLIWTAGGTRVGLVASVAATTLLFAALHGYQGWAGVVDTAIFGGVVLSCLYIYTRSVIAPFAAHAAWNTAAAITLYADPAWLN